MSSLNRNMVSRAKKDRLFVHEMSQGESNAFPGFLSDEIEYAMWSASYYGWLVAKHGALHADMIKNECK